ncbi:Efflux ABC transporter, ATP-binding protein [hydrothermal vent metagenome]|uniref:Efflux ABC transporter, ATP-binding protein n=1 Tax=hydrothermal vent metagenome TaxID=652676 RepID=A0A3B1BXP5_9ZZZZ
MDTTALVEGRGLVKAFNGLTAVDQIDFSVMRGECYGFLGPNGAGKTSTIRMIQCVSPPTGGKLIVDGRQAGKDDRKIKEIIGVVPQEDNLDEELTVIDNLRIYAGYFGIPRRKAVKRGMELLDFFQLADRAKARLRSLSGGMRRRLIIARAMLNDPALLILDEPTTGLDPQARHLIWQRIRKLKGRGVTMILTTHYMEEATQLCDRIAIMDKGKILLEGPPGELVASEIQGDVIEFRPDGKGAEQAVLKLEKQGALIEKAGDTFMIYTKYPEMALNTLATEEHHFLLHRKATLEDLFLKATGRKLKEGG